MADDGGPPLWVRLVLVALASAGATWFAFRFFQVEPAPLPGEVRARVLAPSGAVAETCSATLWKRDGAKRSMGPDSNQRCDEHGMVRWSEVLAGSYALIVGAPGAAETTVEVTTTGEGLEVDDIVLPAGGVVRGTVTRDGQPVVGAEVRLLGGRSARTNEEGAFGLPGVPVGETAVKSIHEHASAEAELVVAAGEVTEVVLELEGLPPKGVLGISGTPQPEGFRVEHVVARGPASGLIELGDVLVATADDGSLVGLPPDAMLAVLGQGLPGEVEELTLVRAMQEKTVSITRLDVTEMPR